MKIRIVGPSGSGKTFLAEHLSQKYQIPSYELDDLFWDNSSGGYNCKRDSAERDAMLENILQNENWIIEGVQHTWTAATFAEADIIYLLELPALLCRFRIIRRFIKRKMNRESRKNETLKSLVSLLRWTKKFYRVNLPEIKNSLLPYENKIVSVSSKREISRILADKDKTDC